MLTFLNRRNKIFKILIKLRRRLSLDKMYNKVILIIKKILIKNIDLIRFLKDIKNSIIKNPTKKVNNLVKLQCL